MKYDATILPVPLTVLLQLALAYSCHYIKERKVKRIFLLRMKQRFIKSFTS